MKKEIALHPAQATILRELLYKPAARFSELNTTGLTNDHFTFHIQQLIHSSLVTKNKENHYMLTAEGKEFANRFDTDTQTVKIEKQAKIGVAICCVKEENGKRFYLLQQRLKQPFYGCYGFMTGKIKMGEKVAETAARELKEEMGIEADLSLFLVVHKLDYNEQNQILEDKFFFEFIGKNIRGDLIEEIEGGKNAWIAEDEIKNLSPTFPDLDKGIEAVNHFLVTKEFTFKEQSYIAEHF